jgi:hypothetical protein
MSLTETQMLVLSHAANREGGFILPLPETCRAKGGAVDKVVAGLIRRGWATAIKGRHLREVPANVEAWKTDEDGDPLYPLITRDGLRAIGVEEPSPELREWAERQPSRIGDVSIAEAQAMIDEANGAAEAAEAGEAVEAADEAPEAPEATPEADTTAEAAEAPADGEPARDEAEAAREPARRSGRAAGVARRRLATARNALEAVCSHWTETGRLDEALIASCRAALAELQRADAELEAEAPAVRSTPREGSKQAQMIALLRRPEGATIAEIAEATGWQPHTVRGAIAGALKKKLGLTVTSEKPEGGERRYRVEA